MNKVAFKAATSFAVTGWMIFVGAAAAANADTTKCDTTVSIMYRPGETVTRCTLYSDSGGYESYEIYCDAGGNCEIN